jgi:Domain of unknown function (DUF2024)
MRTAVWDTYVTRKNGTVMHFDIIAPETVTDSETVYGYGREFLAASGEAGQPLTATQCRFCHIETVRPEWQEAIHQKGYYIYRMEGC